MGLRSILDLSKMRGVFSVLLGLLVSSVLSRVSYDSYSVLRVNVENEAQAELLLQLEEQGGFDFWSEVGLGRPLDVMTAPETKETLTQWLDDHSLQWSVIIEDVGVLIQEQLIPAANAPEPHAKHNMDGRKGESSIAKQIAKARDNIKQTLSGQVTSTSKESPPSASADLMKENAELRKLVEALSAQVA